MSDSDPRGGRRSPVSRDLVALARESPDAVIVAGMDGTILGWNPGAERLYGWSATDMVGRPVADLVPEPRTHKWGQAIDAAAAGRAVPRLETRHRRADGSMVDLLVTITPIPADDGSADRVVYVARDITELKDAQRGLQASIEALRSVAFRDRLTGSGSRELLVEQLGRACSAGGPVALLAVDVDEFQYFNNKLGHTAGDEVLRHVATLLETLAPGCVVARVGGDEFAVVCPGWGADRAADLARRIAGALRHPVPVAGGVQAVSVGIGIAAAGGGASPEVLMRRARLALLEAKHSGKACWRSYGPAMEAAYQARTADEEALRAAVGTELLTVAYQPVSDVRTGAVFGVEGLLRFTTRQGLAVSPEQFIPAAERTGVIVALGDWVLEAACGQAAGWLRRGTPVTVHVNVSPRQLADGAFADSVTRALESTGLPAQRLTLEITESAVMGTGTDLPGQLRGLRALGVGLAVDDFGTGHSSLARLHALPFTCLKIDKSLIDDVTTDRGSRVIVGAVIDMAHALGMTVVAEGVEHRDQLAAIGALGCDLVQGFLLHRPMSAADIARLLDAGSRQPGSGGSHRRHGHCAAESIWDRVRSR